MLLQKGKKKKSKSKDSGRGRSPTVESFQEISGRGEEKQHRKHVKESGKQKLLQDKALPVFCKSLNELVSDFFLNKTRSRDQRLDASGIENKKSLWPWGGSKVRKAEGYCTVPLGQLDTPPPPPPKYQSPNIEQRVFDSWHRGRKPLNLIGPQFPTRTEVSDADSNCHANPLWAMPKIWYNCIGTR